ncbi:hypothetical protein HH214_15515 [Mucilaginibacter robiniae]|uniref:Uncharacterized protein n=1 Tax=Mucilaginibacter robiniae TaxID=2728022 RepID=A0A7L5E468_9SPHI|nr:hypothetical protein [Mucilaginibacter robiniae]QJD97177.1 hypothetical protein HH214_15515 [Mucilaginibacter robiniae]
MAPGEIVQTDVGMQAQLFSRHPAGAGHVQRIRFRMQVQRCLYPAI